MKQFFKILLYFLIISICIGQRPYYKGEWKKNRWHGNGELLDNLGSKYVGEFKNGNYHGQGVIDYYNKARFEGEFRNGKKFNGKYTYAYGETFLVRNGVIIKDKPFGEERNLDKINYSDSVKTKKVFNER